MAWTLAQLQNLEAAIAEGALRVKYEDREVEYRSLKDMEQLLLAMRRELGLLPRGPRRRVASFDKGLGSDRPGPENWTGGP